MVSWNPEFWCDLIKFWQNFLQNYKLFLEKGTEHCTNFKQKVDINITQYWQYQLYQKSQKSVPFPLYINNTVHYIKYWKWIQFWAACPRYLICKVICWGKAGNILRAISCFKSSNFITMTRNANLIISIEFNFYFGIAMWFLWYMSLDIINIV